MRLQGKVLQLRGLLFHDFREGFQTSGKGSSVKRTPIGVHDSSNSVLIQGLITFLFVGGTARRHERIHMLPGFYLWVIKRAINCPNYTAKVAFHRCQLPGTVEPGGKTKQPPAVPLNDITKLFQT